MEFKSQFATTYKNANAIVHTFANKTLNWLQTFKVFEIISGCIIILLLVLVLTLLRTAITPTQPLLTANTLTILYDDGHETIAQWVSPDKKAICYIYNDGAFGNNSMDCFSATDFNFFQVDLFPNKASATK